MKTNRLTYHAPTFPLMQISENQHSTISLLCFHGFSEANRIDLGLSTDQHHVWEITNSFCLCPLYFGCDIGLGDVVCNFAVWFSVPDAYVFQTRLVYRVQKNIQLSSTAEFLLCRLFHILRLPIIDRVLLSYCVFLQYSSNTSHMYM